jgi:hypothetical protein
MNSICIVYNNINSENNYNEIILDFKTNTFTLNNNTHRFEILDKYKISLYWNDTTKEIYYTDDSYLYFSNIIIKSNYKKLYLINTEWYDQALYNIETGTLRRIKHKEQYGNVEYNVCNKFIINWNYWGKEEYIKIDDYHYIAKEYKNSVIEEMGITLCDASSDPSIKIYIFIHVCTLDGWKDILIDQLNTIRKSGLYNTCHKINFGILGDCNVVKDPIFDDLKFNIIYIDSRLKLYENHTINSIKWMCSNGDINEPEAYILYIHTKGVRKAGNSEVTESWRKMMEYFLIDRYKDCIDALQYYDTLGNNIVNMGDVYVNKNKEHCMHYSGNFWWSKKSYINKLDYLNIFDDYSINSDKIRYSAENWLLSLYPGGKFGTIFQDDTNTHPYHRYVFDYYKKFVFSVKNIRL